jgi:hypothetical protein
MFSLFWLEKSRLLAMVISGSPPSFDQFLESFSKSIENFTDVRIKDMEKVS